MATVRSRKRQGGTYWFVVDRFGHERKMGPGPKGEAAAKRACARLELAEWAERRGEPLEDLQAGPARWTLKDLEARDLEAHAGRASLPSRTRLWRVMLEGFGEATLLHELTPARIQAWAIARGRKVSAQTVNNGLSLLSAALKYARRMRDASGFTANPFAEVSRLPKAPSKVTRAEPDEKVREIIRAAWRRALAAPAWLVDQWRDDAAIIELTYLTSSRISQILQLRWEQLDRGVLHFPPHKLGAPRDFIVTPRMARILAKIPNRGEYVFPPEGRARKYPYRVDIKSAWRAVAPAGFTVHGLRHSAITSALYAGEPLPDVANRGGWKDLQMLTKLYGHIFRKPIGAAPRAGVRTAQHAGARSRGKAGQTSKSAHRARAS